MNNIQSKPIFEKQQKQKFYNGVKSTYFDNYQRFILGESQRLNLIFKGKILKKPINKQKLFIIKIPNFQKERLLFLIMIYKIINKLEEKVLY